MRLNRYITELGPDWVTYLPVYGMSIDEVNQTCQRLRDDLEKHCSVYRSRAGGLLCYRGIKGKQTLKDKLSYTKKIPHSERIPRDTPLYVSKSVDLLFKKQFGWKPREEGLFVTGDIYTSNGYGWSYVVVPIGDFKFLWSPTVFDFFSKYVMRPDSMTDDEQYIEYFKQKYLDSYQDTNLSKAIDIGTEVMIKCKEYYLIGQEFSGVVRDWANRLPFNSPHFK